MRPAAAAARVGPRGTVPHVCEHRNVHDPVHRIEDRIELDSGVGLGLGSSRTGTVGMFPRARLLLALKAGVGMV
jgi:hypothetical protein